MGRKISLDVQRRIIELHEKGFALEEIVRDTQVSRPSVRTLVKARNTINPETNEPFTSLVEYRNYLSRQKTDSETGKSFESTADRREHLILQKINPETNKPFASLAEYNRYCSQKRSENPRNQKLGGLITTRLKELGKSQKWLCAQTGISKQSISFYVQGKTFPSDDYLQKLYEALEVRYETLESPLE